MRTDLILYLILAHLPREPPQAAWRRSRPMYHGNSIGTFVVQDPLEQFIFSYDGAHGKLVSLLASVAWERDHGEECSFWH